MAASILDVFDVLDVLHLLHLGVLLAEEVGRLRGGGDVPQPPSDDRVNTGRKYVSVAASAMALECVGHAAWLLGGAETGAAHISDAALLPGFVGIEWVLLILAVLAERAGSLDELVALGAALPLTAAMVGSSILFLTGENSGSATALLAATALAVVAAVLGRVADAEELPLMYGALGSASTMVFGAAFLLDNDPPAGNGDSVNTFVLMFAMCVAAGASVVAQVAAPEKHMVSQFALAIVAAMVSCSLLLLSEEKMEQGDQGSGWWAIVVVGMLLFAITEKHETKPVLSCMAFFLAAVSWSMRVLSVQGEVAAFVDSPTWIATCWILPGAAILQHSSDMRNGVLMSGALATSAMMVWLALHFLAPDDIPAWVFVTKPSRFAEARLETRGAEMLLRTPLAAESAPGAKAVNLDENVLPDKRTEAKMLSEAKDESFLSEEGRMDEKNIVASSQSESTPSLLESTLPDQQISAEETAGHEDKSSDVVQEERHEAEEMQPSYQSPHEASVAKSKTAVDASADAPVLQAHTQESSQGNEHEYLRAPSEQSVDQNGGQTVNYLLSPGMWTILSSLPIIGQSVDTKAGVSGFASFAVAAGAATFLTAYMFECAFAYLAPDDAGPSMCFKPTLLWYAAAVMMVSIAAVPVSYSPHIKNRAGSSVSNIVACVWIGVFLTASMAGCALHHVAPEDIGKLACGPFSVFASPAVTTLFHRREASAHTAVSSVIHANEPLPATAEMRMAAREALQEAANLGEQQRATDAAQQAEEASKKEEEAAQKIEEQRLSAEAAQEMQAVTDRTEAEAAKAAEAAEAAAAQAAAKLEEQRSALKAAQELQAATERAEAEAAEATKAAEAAKAMQAAAAAKEHGVDDAGATAEGASSGKLPAEAAEERVKTDMAKTQTEVERGAEQDIKMVEEERTKICETPTETKEQRQDEIDHKLDVARKQVEAEIEATRSRSKQSAGLETANASAESGEVIGSDPEPRIHWTILLLMDIMVIVGIALLVTRSFSSYCSNVGLPFTWVMNGSGDDYDGEVTKIPKAVSIFFTNLTELHPVPHGYGLYTFACGTEYDGGWKEGKMCGVHGKLSFVEGHVYDGEWADGQPNGHGTFTWAGGSVFMGEFSNGVPDGQGIKTWPDGHSYSGQWKAGKKHGFGKYSWADGSSFSGGWSEDEMHGHGTYCFENMDSYTGAWEHDVKCGVGTYRWSDGRSELRVFSDEAAVCPESTVEPGACPKTGRKFVESMSNFRCASAYRSPSKPDGSRPYTSPRGDRPFTPTSPRTRRSGSFKLETGSASTPNGSIFSGVEELA